MARLPRTMVYPRITSISQNRRGRMNPQKSFKTYNKFPKRADADLGELAIRYDNFGKTRIAEIVRFWRYFEIRI